MEIILHHYPQSPVSEKIRTILGIKALSWRSVTIPRLPPKPDLMTITGGYRLTPVMQIGADIYCDTQCIIRELERRFPDASLYPDGPDGLKHEGITWALSRWTDGSLFKSALDIIFARPSQPMPPEFLADRGGLYFTPDIDQATLDANFAFGLSQVQSHLDWIETQLVNGQTYLLGEKPGHVDALCYYIIWFIRGRYIGGPDLLGKFPALCAWEERVKAIGHGSPSDMEASEAISIANANTPVTPSVHDKNDPSGFKPGAPVKVSPDKVNGTASAGKLVSLSFQNIVISRTDQKTGEVHLHFPRTGFRIDAA